MSLVLCFQVFAVPWLTSKALVLSLFIVNLSWFVVLATIIVKVRRCYFFSLFFSRLSTTVVASKSFSSELRFACPIWKTEQSPCHLFCLTVDGKAQVFSLRQKKFSQGFQFNVEAEEILDLPKNANVRKAVCNLDEQRCLVVMFVPHERNKNEWMNHLQTKKRGVNEAPPLVFMASFGVEGERKLQMKVETVGSWKLDVPIDFSFIKARSTAISSLVCNMGAEGVNAFALKKETEKDPYFAALKLSIDPRGRHVRSICYIEGTAALVSASNEVALVLGSKEVSTIKFDAKVKRIDLFQLSKVKKTEFVAALDDGTLHFVVANMESMQISSLFLGSTVNGNPCSCVSWISSMTFKQGPCHLVFIGSMRDDSSISFILPSNPQRRVQHISAFVNLSPVRCIDLDAGNQCLYAAFGSNKHSGVAEVEECFRFRKLVKYSSDTHAVEKVLFLGRDLLCFCLENGTNRFLKVDAVHQETSEIKMTEQSFEAFHKVSFFKLFCFKNTRDEAYFVCVSKTAMTLHNDKGSEIHREDFSPAVVVEALLSRFKDAQYHVALSDGTLKTYSVKNSVFKVAAETKTRVVAGERCLAEMEEDIFIILDGGGNLYTDGDSEVSEVTLPNVASDERILAFSLMLPVLVVVTKHGQQYYVKVFQQRAKKSAWNFVCSCDVLRASAEQSCSLMFLEQYKGFCSFSLAIGAKNFVLSQASENHFVCLKTSGNETCLGSFNLADGLCLSILKGPKKEVSVAAFGEIVYESSVIHRNECNVLFVCHLDMLQKVVFVDEQGKIGVFCKRSGKVQNDCYALHEALLISDFQCIRDAEGEELVAVCVCSRNAVRDRKLLNYGDREVRLLRVREGKNGVFIEQSSSHHSIRWDGIGSCNMMIRGFALGRSSAFVVACDTKLSFYRYGENSPAPQLLNATDLAEVSGNDIISSISVQGQTITLSHMFGAMLCVEWHPESKGVTLESNILCPGDCITVMLNKNVGLCSLKGGPAHAMEKNGKLLVKRQKLIEDHGVLCCTLNEKRETAFVGSRTGEIYAVKAVTDDSEFYRLSKFYDVVESYHFEEPLSTKGKKKTFVIDGNIVRTETTNKRGEFFQDLLLAGYESNVDSFKYF